MQKTQQMQKATETQQNQIENLENCPSCGSGNTVALDDLFVEGSTVWRKVGCNTCDTIYNEIFAIVKREIVS